MTLTSGIPKAKNSPIIEGGLQAPKINNQFVLTGVNPAVGSLDLVYFLEYVQGTNFTIKDRDGNAVTGVIPSLLDLTKAPLRMEGGITITGTVLIAKGFSVVAKGTLEV